MMALRVFRSSIFEAVVKRYSSSLALAASSTLGPSVTWQKISPLPLAAQQRCQHTVTTSPGRVELSKWEQFKWSVGIFGKLKVPKKRLIQSGLGLYICCTDFINMDEFTTKLNLPDTFNTWFLLLQLHLWLVHVRLAQMGREGLLLKDVMYENLWMDVERRFDTFQDLKGSDKKTAFENYYSLMYSSLFYLDEGLISNDQGLANSLWLQLFSQAENVDPRHLEIMVEYVRKQVHHLDNMKEDLIMNPGYVSFLPLHGNAVDKAKVERDLKAIREMK